MKGTVLMKTIEIKNGRRKIYYHRQYLAQKGLKFVKRSYGKSYYTKKVTSIEENELVNYCKNNGLKYSIIEDIYMRNASYRQDFMNQIQDKKYVFCAYCGLLIKTDKITVDHIIPVNKTKQGKKGARWLMKILKIDDVNSIKNLAAACQNCNSRKRTKMGLWILRGFIGKNDILWIIRWILRIIILIILVYMTYWLFQPGNSKILIKMIVEIINR